MDEKKNNAQDQQVRSQPDRKNQNIIPDDFKPANDPGKEATAKTERKGAGQQQDSAGNPVINS